MESGDNGKEKNDIWVATSLSTKRNGFELAAHTGAENGKEAE
jgi:hypothetical protein